MIADSGDISGRRASPRNLLAAIAVSRRRAAHEMRLAARAQATIRSIQAEATAGPEYLRELRARRIAAHRKAAERHQAAARLHEQYATRMEAWIGGARERDLRPGFMAVVAAAIGVESATATVRGQAPSAVVAASSDATARAAHELESTLGEGPAAAAAAGGVPLRLGGQALRERWPLYGPAVAELGVHAVTAVPLQVSAACVGTLCAYGAAPVMSDTVAAAAGQVADALTHAVLLGRPGTPDVLLGEADYQAGVHQAAGMVSARCGCGIDDAQALLRARAFADGQPLELVARGVLIGDIRLW